MYNRTCAAAAAGCTGGGLALTGWNITWLVIAGATLVVLGGVILRLVPRRAGVK